MDVREKLVELQLKADLEDETSENTTQHREYIADLMIAHGVTVQGDKDINVPTNWISVKDRLPDPFEVVLVYDDTDKCVEEAYMTRHKEWVGIKIKNHVTHWLPLPQPPKGE
jgi:hypothetical protein